ncbi:MAG: hypothetical protein PHE83_09385 [Opitutaceae bacterium]|nr:hypothetical protein [Opitutaceae bacterium]
MNPHGMFIGATGSGKTFAAQQSAKSFRHQSPHPIKTLILHKPLEIWPGSSATWQTEDPEKYLWKWERSRGCACFMELADALVDKWDERFWRCFTQGRHYGHRCYYISQRAAFVHPAIRDNCASLHLFAVPQNAAKMWAVEFNDPALLGAVKLPPRWFYFKPDRYTPARLMTLAA